MKRKFKQVMKQKSKIKAANFAKMKVSKNKKNTSVKFIVGQGNPPSPRRRQSDYSLSVTRLRRTREIFMKGFLSALLSFIFIVLFIPFMDFINYQKTILYPNFYKKIFN